MKIQLHGMFLDTCFNELATVLANLFRCFLDAAQRSFEYVKSLPGSGRRRSNELLISKQPFFEKSTFAEYFGRGRIWIARLARLITARVFSHAAGDQQQWGVWEDVRWIREEQR